MKKALIFDSSAIISLALNDLLYILEPLKKIFGGDFLISSEVKKEIIDNSLKNKKFMLEALNLKSLIDQGTLTFYESQKANSFHLNNIANNTFFSNNHPIPIVHAGEISCLEIYKNLNIPKKAVVIDERTTRLLCENPRNLKNILEKKLHLSITSNEKNYPYFKDIKVIRSSELIFIALKKNLIKLPTNKKNALEALLYALKFKGCAISDEEIMSAKKLISV